MTLVRLGMEETWIITDHFMQQWRAWLVPVEERLLDEKVVPSWEQPEDPLSHMIYYSFTDEWALCDDMASDLIGIYDALTGAALGDELPEPTRDPRRILRGFKAELHDILYAATSAGILKVERYEVPWPFPEKDEKPKQQAPEKKKTDDTWFSLTVLDEVGAPIDGISIAYSLGGERKTISTNGSGVARLGPLDSGSAATASLVSIAAVKEKLKPRWAKPRAPNIPQGENVALRELADPLDGVSLEAEKPATLVLTPYFKCNEILGTHFEFGRSFVRSSALEQLAPLAEALHGDDGRKAMIFGHTDTTGAEVVNKELSERRAKALHALLTHDADAWEELYSGSADGANWKEKWDLEEAQHMLNALGVTDDEGNKLDEDGVRGPSTKQAIHNFQKGNYPDCPSDQAPLEQSDTLEREGRKALFLAYAKRISRTPVDADRIGKIGDASFMGCGEFNPLSIAARDEQSRRAVIFIYDPAAEPQGLPCQLRSLGPCKSNCGPAPDAPDPDGKPPYRCKIYQDVAQKCPCAGGVDLSHDLILRFPLTLKEASDLSHTYILASDDGTIERMKRLASDGRANDKQRVEIYFEHLPLTHAYKVSCTGVDEPYDLFDYAKLPDLQARATELEDAGSADGSLNDYWLANKDAPAEDDSASGEDGASQGSASGGSP